MSTWKELQDRLNAYQTGTVEAPDVSLIKKSNLTGPVVAPAPTEEPVYLDELKPEISGKDILGYQPEGNVNLTRQAIQEGYGNSRFDSRSGYVPGENREDIRAREQSGFGKVMNGILKAGVTAFDTFADTTFGTVAGAAQAFSPVYWLTGRNPYTLQKTEKADNPLEAFVNNPVSETLNKWTRNAEEWFPNYRTVAEQSDDYQSQWYVPSHFFSANNIGDGLIKNFGFTVGAMLGGLSWGKILGFGKASAFSDDVLKGVAVASSGDAEASAAMKELAPRIQQVVTEADAKQLAQNMSKVARKHNWLPFTEQLTGSIIAAAGEGKTEGLMAKEEFLEDYMATLQQKMNADIADLEQKVLANKMYQAQVIDANNPTAEPKIVLNNAGEVYLQKRKNELFDSFRKEQELAVRAAEDISALTFALNMPILTGSNAIQFGRLLGGGWRSAKQAASRVGGKLRWQGGAPVAEYVGRSQAGVAAKTIGALGKLAGAEATEEMLQGTVSSGAKQIADDKLTAFHDRGYDRAALNSMRDRFASFVQGGADYLGDIKNWQEGALGALTGLFGMPGKGYFRGERGGVFGAIAEGKENLNTVNSAAQKLNDYVNSEDFQNRWRGWVRHEKYNKDAKKAVEDDNEYAYHTADGAQLVSDIVMFSDAGRLDDLYQIADRFSNLSKDDIDEIRNQLSANDGSVSKYTDQQIKERVEKQAKRMKSTIEKFSKIEEEARARLPIGATSDILKEVVFTQMQMGSFEERFLTMLSETLQSVTPVLDAKVKSDDSIADKQDGLLKLQSEYASIFGGSLVPISKAKQEETEKKLEDLRSLIKGNSTLEKKVSDMEKLMNDRQKYYEKLQTLQKITPDEYNAQAVTEEDNVKAAEKELAQQEAADFTSLAAVRNAYKDAGKSKLSTPTEFVGRMRKIADENPNVKRFVNIFDAYDKIRQRILKAVGRDEVALWITDEMFDKAQGVDDMLNPASVPNYDSYSREIQAQINAAGDTEQMVELAARAYSEDAYNSAASVVAQAINGVNDTRSKTSAAVSADKKRQELGKEKKPAGKPIKEQPSTSKEPPQPSSPAIPPKQMPKKSSMALDASSATDAAGNVWNYGETVYFWDSTKKNVTDSEEGVVSGFRVNRKGEVEMLVDFPNRSQKFNLVYQLPAIHKTQPAGTAVEKEQGKEKSEVIPDVVDATPAEEVSDVEAEVTMQETQQEVLEDSRANADGDKDYYQFGVPEYPVEDVKAIRNERDSAKRRTLIQALKPLVQKSPAFEKVQAYLTRNNAKKNAADLKVGETVYFGYVPSLGMYNGKPQMVMYTKKDGEVRVLNVMRMSGKYAGLTQFWNEVMKEFKDEDTRFTFSKSSTVWAKRRGIITYNLEEKGRNKPVNSKELGYNENAPIVWFSREGVAKVIRGDRNAVQIVRTWSEHDPEYFRAMGYAGRMYYLSDDGAGGFIPVRLNQKHFNLGNYQSDEEVTRAVMEKLSRIKEITSRYFAKMMDVGDDVARQQQVIDSSNEELHREISELRGNTGLLLKNKLFSFGVGENGPALTFIKNYKEGKGDEQLDSYDREYIGEMQFERLEEIIAAQNWAYDFKVDRDEQREGADMPITRANLEEYIDAGLLLTNATSLIPANVDAYIERWNPKTNDFNKPLTKEQEADRESNAPQELVPETRRTESVFTSVEPEVGEFGGEESYESIPVFDAEGIEKWESIPEEGKAYLKKHGITEDKFYEMSSEQQDHWIDCLGA